MEFVCLFTLILFLNIKDQVRSLCSNHTSKGCEYCVKQTYLLAKCRWCVLDDKCHVIGSMGPSNPCTKDQVITNFAKCPTKEVFGEYSPRNSYNLLRLSTIPYVGHQNGALKCLDSHKMNDYEIVEWIGRHCEDLHLIEYKECVAVVMISHKRKNIVLAYRGTSSFEQLLDEISKTLFTSKEPDEIGKGKVGSYFKKAHDKLYNCVAESIQDQIFKYSDYNIWVTGHSLGGALASLASARLLYDQIIRKDKTALYTFGMPRVGDRQYAIEHNRLLNNSWRVVHHLDPIPHLPLETFLPSGSYHHRTEVYYPSTNMLPSYKNYNICPGSDSACGEWKNAVIEDHKMYFNIHVGTYCQGVIGRKRRSIKSEMWNQFNNNTCSRIKNSFYSHLYNRAMLFNGYIQTTVLLILLQCVMFI